MCNRSSASSCLLFRHAKAIVTRKRLVDRRCVAGPEGSPGRLIERQAERYRDRSIRKRYLEDACRPVVMAGFQVLSGSYWTIFRAAFVVCDPIFFSKTIPS